MTNPQDQGNGGNQYNQHIRARGRGRVFATQDGDITINEQARARTWTGWAILILLVVDIAFFFYGKGAYTGREGDAGDMWRAGIALFLFVTTIGTIRRWFVQRLRL